MATGFRICHYLSEMSKEPNTGTCRGANMYFMRQSSKQQQIQKSNRYQRSSRIPSIQKLMTHLYAGRLEIIHGINKGRKNLLVVILLQVRAQISGQLADGIDSSPAHTSMWILKWVQNHGHNWLQILYHHLHINTKWYNYFKSNAFK